LDGCEILRQVIGGKHPIIYRFSTIPGAGFRNHPKEIMTGDCATHIDSGDFWDSLFLLLTAKQLEELVIFLDISWGIFMNIH
jgi:hypothetical protein